jgi:hypothetical protein
MYTDPSIYLSTRHHNHHRHTEKQYLWRDPVFVDIFGAEYFPPQYTVQSRLNGLDGVARSLDLILRVCGSDASPTG